MKRLGHGVSVTPWPVSAVDARYTHPFPKGQPKGRWCLVAKAAALKR